MDKKAFHIKNNCFSHGDHNLYAHLLQATHENVKVVQHSVRYKYLSFTSKYNYPLSYLC